MSEIQRLQISVQNPRKLNHYMFRYPAKFHPPVARALVEEYSSPQDVVFDPFCGSGTLLVEAMVAGRNSIGTDLDPVAVLVSTVKTRRIDLGLLSEITSQLFQELQLHRRSDEEYLERRFVDITDDTLWDMAEKERLWIPEIPNITHWFRRYVLLDLARIHNTIQRLEMPETHKDFFLLCFAAILRNASNADPVPVSGLEVTSHMKKLDSRGRIVDPFDLFEQTVKSNVEAVSEFQNCLASEVSSICFEADATDLAAAFAHKPDVIITSPPYQTAVDYYRRHKLEMYWLRFVSSQKDRLDLLPRYIGRYGVGASDLRVIDGKLTKPLAVEWEQRLRAVDEKRANSFKHYIVSLARVASQFALALSPGKLAVIVIGNSKWRDNIIPTKDLMIEVMADDFLLTDEKWYPLKNRYMSYERRNNANIDKEYVLAFKRK